MMASQPCWRCFARLTIRPTLTNPPTARPLPAWAPPARFLSTTASIQAPDVRRAKRSLKIKRKRRERTHKVPAIGERKAIRQRVVLSNTNALEVQDMRDWQASNCTDEALLGKVIGIPGEVVDGLRALGSFKPSQGWGLFRRPASLIRLETLELAKSLQDVKEQTLRRLVVGARGVGKSVWLLQAQAVALMKGWVVIHIPEGKDITNAATSYAPLPKKTEPQQYIQPEYTAALLTRIARANETVLSTLTVSLNHDDLPIPIRSGTTLLSLAEKGAQDHSLAWPIFNALWTELTTTNDGNSSDTSSTTKNSRTSSFSSSSKQSRPPILLTLDGLAHASRQSLYLTPSMHHIHAHDLSLLTHFFAHLSGAKSLPNGGAILAAESSSNRPETFTLDLAVRQSEKRSALLTANPESAPEAQPLYDVDAPYTRVDERVLKSLRNVPVVRLKGFSKEETRAALEYYARSGMLRARVTEGLVGERWAVSGGGVVGELEKASVSAGIL